MKPILLKDVIRAVSGELLNATNSDIENMTITDVSIDSRKIQNMTLFIPIVGSNVDGHTFIKDVFTKGALCALTEKSEEGIIGNNMVIYVKNTVIALGDLARFYIAQFDINIIAITGSVGKTSTKDMIASILSKRFNILKTEGNFNNEIGLPLTIFEIDTSYNTAILEMGMSEFGEIRYLSNIAKPNIAVISNIGSSHIENLGSREGILKAKSEIFENLKQGGLAVLNSDDDMLVTLKDNLSFDIGWFGIENKIGVYADHIEFLGLDGVKCDIHIDGEVLNVNIPSPGKHMVYNVMAGIVIAKRLGLSLDDIKEGIKDFIPSKMRMDIIKANNNITIINDTYNASPQSMEAAIDVLKYSGGKRKIAILGDMLELGEFAPELHSGVGAYAATCGIDIIICVGEFSKVMYEAANSNKSLNQDILYFESQEILQKKIFNIIKEEDTILVKASRGMHLEKTVDKIEKVEL